MKDCLDKLKRDSSIPSDQKKLLNVPLPNPFCFNKKTVKAVVLGADPSNFSDNGSTVFLDTVFGIGSEDARYFKDIMINLNLIGLHLENVYVQNVVRNYMVDETGKSKHWEAFADHWLPCLVDELNRIDKLGAIPVLVTAERILKFLVKEDYKLEKARSIYDTPSSPIPAVKNKLGRPLLALYRHPDYKLSQNSDYRVFLANFWGL